MTQLDDLDKFLGLTSDPVPMPRPQQDINAIQQSAAATPAPPEPTIIPQPSITARLPIPRPTLPSDQPIDQGSDLDQFLASPAPASASDLDQWLGAGAEGSAVPPGKLAQGGDAGAGGYQGSPNTLPPAGVAPYSFLSQLEAAPGVFPRSIMRGFNEAQSAGYADLAASGIVSPKTAASGIKSQSQDMNDYAVSQQVVQGQQEAAGLEKSGAGPLSWMKLYMQYPAYTADIMGSSIGTSAPSLAGTVGGAGIGALAGGAIAGPPGAVLGGLAGKMIGTGFASFATDAGSSILSFLNEKKGIDLSNEEQVAGALANPEVMKEATQYGVKHGVPVAALDALSSLVAPKAGSWVANRLGRSVEGVAGRVATRSGAIAGAGAGIGTEAAFGGGGEALGQIAASGHITSMGDIMAEIVGELGSGGPELVAAGYHGAEGGAHGTLTPTDASDFSGLGVDLPPRVVSPEQAASEGRTLYGFDTGTGKVSVGTYDDAEAQMQREGSRNGKLIAVSEGDAPTQVFDVAKIKKSTYGNVDITAPDEDLKTRAAVVVNTIRHMNGDRLEPAIQELDGLIQQGVRLSDNVMSRVFSGDSTHLGVHPRQINYGGFDLPHTPLEAGKTLNSHTYLLSGEKNAPFDLDLNKLSSTALVLSPGAIRDASFNFGPDVVMQLAKDGGSTPEALELLRQELSPSGGSGMDFNNALESGDLKFKPDARLVTDRGARIRNTPEAAAEVNAAKVPHLEGSYKKDNLNLHRIGRHGYIFRTFDNSTGVAKLTDAGKVLGRIPRDVRKAIYAGTAAAHAAIQALKLPHNVRIVPYMPGMRGASKVSRESRNSYGFFNPTDLVNSTDRHSTLMVRADRSAAEVYATIFHELGHFLHGAGFLEMHPEVRTQVLAAYRRFLQGTSVMTQQESAQRSAMPGRESGQSNPAYLFSFHEWFADQVARAAITGGRKQFGFVGKVFAPLGRMLRIVAHTFQSRDPTNEFRAEPEIEKMLGNAFQDPAFNQEWSSEFQRLHDLETLRANQVALEKGEDIGNATPMTSMSVSMRSMMPQLDETQVHSLAAANGSTPLPSFGTIFSQVDRFNWFYKQFLGLLQIADRNLHIAPLQMYRELAQMAQTTQAKIMSQADARLTEWRKLGTGQAEALGKFLFDMTQMNYLSPAEQAANVVRHPTPAEMQRIAQQHGLSREGLRVYANVQLDFVEALRRYTDYMRQQALKISDPAAQQQKLNDINAQERSLLRRPYFPMTRYGKWSLTVRDGKNKVEHFELFESKRQQQAAYKKARNVYPSGSGYTVQMSILKEESRGFVGVPPQMLDLIGSSLNLSQQQKEDLEILKVELAPAASFRKRFLNRNEVSGYSEDAQRNYAHYMFHHAKHHMRTSFHELLANQVKNMDVLVPFRGDDARKLTQIRNYMRTHMEEFLNPKGDFAALRSAVATFYLGGSPKSALLNLTQLPTATVPFLSAKFGDLKTASAMTRASLDVKNFYRKKTIAGMTNQEMKALSLGMEEGFIDEGRAANLAALAEGNTLLASVPGDSVRKKWTQISALMMKMFEETEQFNRRVTFRAAYKLAIENPTARWLVDLQQKHNLQYNRLLNMGWSHADSMAFLAGKDSVQSTQFEYAKYARPRYMQGRGAALFQFQLFTNNMLFLMWNNKGVMPRTILTLAFMGGLMGVPGAEDANDLIKAIAGRFFGKDFDLEVEARKFMAELLGDKNLVDIAMRGVGRVGFGMSTLAQMAGITAWPDVDMSKSIGMGNVLPINPAFLIGSPGQSQEKMATQALQDNAGPAFGTMFNLWMAANDTSTPWYDMKRWERALPMALRNGYKAFRLYSEGEERDRGGAKVATFDRQDPEQVAEMVGIALGFSPTRLNRAWDYRIKTMDSQMFWKARRAMVTGELLWAIQKGDSNDVKDAMSSIRSFNSDVTDPTYKLNADQIRSSLRTKIQDQKKREIGLPVGKQGIGISLEMQKLYPQAVEVRKLSTLEQTK